MRNETVTTSTRESFPQEYSWTRVETRVDIAETIRQLNTTGCAQIALVIVTLAYKKEEKNEQAGHARQSSTYLLQNIRSLVRKTDRVFLHEHNMHFVLPGANLQGARIVEERLWEALLWRVHNMGGQEMPRPEKITTGHGAYPQPSTTPEELIIAAAEVSKDFEKPSRRVLQRSSKRSCRKEETVSQAEQEELSRLARKLGIPYLSLLPRNLPQRVQQIVDVKLAQELHCYPLGRERNMLTVAMLDPQDNGALERLRQETGLRIFPVLAHPEALENALKQLH